MKRWKKFLLVLLVVVFVSQIPFAYRRYKLGRLHAAIQQINSQRVVTPTDAGVIEYKGVMHVHSFLGGHSSGNFDDIIAAAQANQLNFVVMTEHPSNNFDTARMTLSDEHGGVLFINGNEASTASGDRLLLLPGDWRATAAGSQSTKEVLANQPPDRLAFVAYPSEFKSWDESGCLHECTRHQSGRDVLRRSLVLPRLSRSPVREFLSAARGGSEDLG